MSLEFKALALLALVAGAILGYVAWAHHIAAEAVAACEARHDAADAAALRRNIEAQQEIRVEANRMAQRARDVAPGVAAASRRLFNALACPERPAPPPGSASAPAQPDLRADVLREVEGRLGALALEADLRGAAGRGCEQSYDTLRK